MFSRRASACSAASASMCMCWRLLTGSCVPLTIHLMACALSSVAQVLLHAWITIHGEAVNGGAESTTVRFNSVTDHIMLPFVERLRPTPTAGAATDLEAERARFNDLGRTHFKFMSYGQGAIRPGARVDTILLQPQIRRELIGLLGFSLSRLIGPAHLTILTDSELILIRDDESQRWSRRAPHGAIWTYIPRARILDVSVAPGNGDVQALSSTSLGPFAFRRSSSLHKPQTWRAC